MHLNGWVLRFSAWLFKPPQNVTYTFLYQKNFQHLFLSALHRSRSSFAIFSSNCKAVINKESLKLAHSVVIANVGCINIYIYIYIFSTYSPLFLSILFLCAIFMAENCWATKKWREQIMTAGKMRVSGWNGATLSICRFNIASSTSKNICQYLKLSVLPILCCPRKASCSRDSGTNHLF